MYGFGVRDESLGLKVPSEKEQLPPEPGEVLGAPSWGLCFVFVVCFIRAHLWKAILERNLNGDVDRS